MDSGFGQRGQFGALIRGQGCRGRPAAVSPLAACAANSVRHSSAVLRFIPAFLRKRKTNDGVAQRRGEEGQVLKYQYLMLS